jgi:hypothetical protein
MSSLQTESVATEILNSSFPISDVEEAMVAQDQPIIHLELAGANEWKRLLEKEGVLTEDEKDFIDCLLEAVRQANSLSWA